MRLDENTKNALRHTAPFAVACLAFVAGVLWMIHGVTSASVEGEYATYGVAESVAANFDAGLSDDTLKLDTVETSAPVESVEKVIRSATVDLTVDDLTRTVASVKDAAAGSDASIEASSESDGYASFSYRIDAEKLDTFVDALRALGGDGTRVSFNTHDATKTYDDNARRLESLETEQDALDAMLGDAETVEEVLAVRDRLTELEYEIAGYAEQNESIDYDAEYASVYVTVTERSAPGTSEGRSMPEELREALRRGLEGLGHVLVGVVTLWPLWLGVLAGTALYRARRRRKSKEGGAADAAGQYTDNADNAIKEDEDA